MADHGQTGGTTLIREVSINGKTARLSVEGSTLRYQSGGQELTAEFSIQETRPASYSVLLGTRSFQVTAGEAGEIWVDGQRFDVQAFDPRDRRQGAGPSSVRGAQRVTSPMPGKVVRVLVSVGDEVAEGQGLVVVEAMKMQNEIKSAKSGRVAEVRASDNITVAAGEVLVVVE